jgi:hypothetical protein
MTISTLVHSSILPVSSSSLWANIFLPSATWSPSIVLSEAWSTDVKRARSLAEDRYSLLGKPYRTIEFATIAHGISNVHSLYLFLKRISYGRNLIPIYCDVTTITAIESGARVIYCDTRYRRFFADQYVVIYDPNTRVFEVAVTASVTDTQIQVTSPLTKVFSAGCKVYPLMETRVNVSQSIDIMTDRTASMTLQCIESEGRTAIPIHVLQSPPSVFDFLIDWNRVSIENTRVATTEASGRGTSIVTYGAQSLMSFNLSMTFVQRSEAWRFIKFFNYCKGRGKSFYFINPLCTYEVTSIDQFGVSVKALGEPIDWRFKPYVGIVMRDGTVHVKEIDQNSISRTNNVDILTWTQADTNNFADYRKVTVAHRVRFGSDELRQTWVTTEHMTTDIELIDVLNEYTVDSGINPVV